MLLFNLANKLITLASGNINLVVFIGAGRISALRY